MKINKEEYLLIQDLDLRTGNYGYLGDIGAVNMAVVGDRICNNGVEAVKRVCYVLNLSDKDYDWTTEHAYVGAHDRYCIAGSYNKNYDCIEAPRIKHIRIYAKIIDLSRDIDKEWLRNDKEFEEFLREQTTTEEEHTI